jgi:hypothetical protein
MLEVFWQIGFQFIDEDETGRLWSSHREEEAKAMM